MLRIAGVTVPDNKRLEIALTAIFGVGRPRALSVLSDLKIDSGLTTADLTPAQEASIRDAIERFTIEGDLRRQVGGNIKRLKDINAHRGTRHAKKLPARGQRSKTNSRTVRGNVRKTMTSGRRKLEKT
ncbi:MAG: 30S ribosomal protein S13 [Candidatus Pacebacteria bacterium]|nr:30S ribosomal protein S13 [Candidatus Paceibacterota bacterium]